MRTPKYLTHLYVPFPYMLLACLEVRIGKNCDRGLENTTRGRRPRAAFLSPRSQFFPIRTDPKPANNVFIFFSCAKLAYKWVCLRNFVIELAFVPFTNHSQSINQSKTLFYFELVDSKLLISPKKINL